jgi:hypothetical protein
MIRVIAIAALTLLLIFVPYLPAANPPQRFLAQVRIEHDLQVSLWGQDKAERIMEHMLAMNEALGSASPIPAASPDAGAHAASRGLERVNRRFFGNAYFRSIDALLVLATYRLAALAEWMPVEAFMILALVMDGLMVRIVRSKEFVAHDPEWFALHASAFMLLACASVVAFTVPVTISPLLLAVLPVLGGFFMGRVAANYLRLQ